MSNFWEKLPRPILALAPMAGVTDLPFRIMCRHLGADLVYSEMIMVQALTRKSSKTLQLTKINKREQPVIIQLGGNDPELFYQSAKILQEIGPAGIDINLGCPARKIAGQGSGVALLRDLERSYQIIQATISGAGSLPVSIKTRTQIKSPDKKQTNTSLDLIQKIKDLSVAAIMIHGRSFEAPWIEEVDYQFIKEVKDNFSGVVLANGGISTPEIAKKVLETTGADGLGVGHSIYGRPWFFQQIKDYLQEGHYTDLTWPEKRTVAIDHAGLVFQTKGARGLIEFRKHLLSYVQGLKNAKECRQNLVKLETLEEIINVLMAIK
jgi:nifR3 family TIM-barrel protein